MICIIRIRGEVNMDGNVKETLHRLRLRKKYTCIVLNPNKEQAGMISKVKNLVAFGEISKETFEKLIEKRGQPIDKKKKKVDAKKVVEELESGKKYEDLNLKPFFRLHPARGGINTKIHFPKGVLGNHGDKINKLVEKML
ncbi:MAG: uL30 family ribosomal protein [Nanoarchaeota archaeon]